MWSLIHLFGFSHRPRLANTVQDNTVQDNTIQIITQMDGNE